MASKMDFKKLLIEKGEKIGLGVGVAVMALLIVLGIMTAAGAESATDTANDLTKKAQTMTKTLDTVDVGDPKPLSPELAKAGGKTVFEPYPYLAYAQPQDYFDWTAATTNKK